MVTVSAPADLDNRTLEHLLASRADRLGAIAAGWIDAGASAVELWGIDGLTARWAPTLELGPVLAAQGGSRGRMPGAHGRVPRGGGIHAPVACHGSQRGWLRVVGVNGGVTRRRLIADAGAIGTLLEHEDDLAALTDALVESQDQLLGIVTLLRAVDPAAGPEALAATVAFHARGLLEVPVAAIALPATPSAPGPVAAGTDVAPAGRRVGGWSLTTVPGRESDVVADLLDDLVLDPAGGDGVTHVTPDGWLVVRSAGRPGRVPLLVAGPSGAHPWTSPAIHLAAAIADAANTLLAQVDHVADAMERARLERQLAFAGEVQRLLLSRPAPAPAGLEVATRYAPAGSVGGDFFAVRPAGDRTLVALGDVSGKGAPAALLMATCRAVFEASAADAEGPAALLDRMAAVLTDDLTAATAFITLCVAEIDPGRGQLRIANAGHSPVLLRSASGVRLLVAEDPPVGVLDDATHSERREPFAPGDVLLLATDGITERESPSGEQFGLDRLIDHLAVADGHPERIAERLLADVDRFADALPRGDDETLLVARGTAR